jgi:UDP-2-acetamido-3-amino-2,3-dideoxy-glucuronate N-acetyltransferase
VISADVEFGEGVVVYQPDLVNLYGCRIGSGSRIGALVEIQRGADVGVNCKISSHSFLCSGVTIEDRVFIGHGVMFVNDAYPRATSSDGSLQTEEDWVRLPTIVRHDASIGSNATILGGITIGRHALVGAGAVVSHDVPDYAIVAGVPARVIGDVRTRKIKSAPQDDPIEVAG